VHYSALQATAHNAGYGRALIYCESLVGFERSPREWCLDSYTLKSDHDSFKTEPALVELAAGGFVYFGPPPHQGSKRYELQSKGSRRLTLVSSGETICSAVRPRFSNNYLVEHLGDEWDLLVEPSKAKAMQGVKSRGGTRKGRLVGDSLVEADMSIVATFRQQAIGWGTRDTIRMKGTFKGSVEVSGHVPATVVAVAMATTLGNWVGNSPRTGRWTAKDLDNYMQ